MSGAGKRFKNSRGKKRFGGKRRNKPVFDPQDSHVETDDSLANISLEELQQLKKDGYEKFAKQTNKSKVYFIPPPHHIR